MAPRGDRNSIVIEPAVSSVAEPGIDEVTAVAVVFGAASLVRSTEDRNDILLALQQLL